MKSPNIQGALRKIQVRLLMDQTCQATKDLHNTHGTNQEHNHFHAGQFNQKERIYEHRSSAGPDGSRASSMIPFEVRSLWSASKDSLMIG